MPGLVSPKMLKYPIWQRSQVNDFLQPWTQKNNGLCWLTFDTEKTYFRQGAQFEERYIYANLLLWDSHKKEEWIKIFFFQCIFFLTSYNGAKEADSVACSLPMAPQNTQRMLLAVITIQKTHGHYIKHSPSSVAYVLSQTNTTMQSFLYVKYLGLIKWNDGVCCLKFISLALWHSLVPRDTETSFSWPIGLI